MVNLLQRLYTADAKTRRIIILQVRTDVSTSFFVRTRRMQLSDTTMLMWILVLLWFSILDSRAQWVHSLFFWTRVYIHVDTYLSYILWLLNISPVHACISLKDAICQYTLLRRKELKIYNYFLCRHSSFFFLWPWAMAYQIRGWGREVIEIDSLLPPVFTVILCFIIQVNLHQCQIYCTPVLQSSRCIWLNIVQHVITCAVEESYPSHPLSPLSVLWTWSAHASLSPALATSRDTKQVWT